MLLSADGSATTTPPVQIAEEIVAAETQPIEKKEGSYTVKMTGYNAVPAQTDSSPEWTASGARSNAQVVAARSRDLAEELPFGTIIEVVTRDGVKNPCGISTAHHLIGYRVIADTMHSRKKNQIDIMFENDDRVTVGSKKVNAALALGICDDIEIRAVGFVDINDIPRSQLELVARINGAELAMR